MTVKKKCFFQQKLQSSKGHGRRKAGRKTDLDSEESESDGDQLTSSRTESSNQLDMKLKHSEFQATSSKHHTYIEQSFH